MRYTIYVQEKDMDALDHIKKQRNSSQYVIDLTRKDMEKRKDLVKSSNEYGKQEIKEIVLECLEEIKNTVV